MKRINQWFRNTAGRISLAVALMFGVMMGWVDAALASACSFLLMAKAIESQGITLQVSEGSPTSFQTIANVTGFSGPGGSASVIDITNLLSTAKEKLMGLPDEGQFTMDLNFDPDGASHIRMRDARAARQKMSFKINFTDATPSSVTFDGYVLGFAISGAVDQQVKAALTIEIDGPAVWA